MGLLTYWISIFSFLSNNTFFFLAEKFSAKVYTSSLLYLSSFWGISLKGELTVDR